MLSSHPITSKCHLYQSETNTNSLTNPEQLKYTLGLMNNPDYLTFKIRK